MYQNSLSGKLLQSLSMTEICDRDIVDFVQHIIFALMYLFSIGVCLFKIHIKIFFNSSQDIFRTPNVLRLFPIALRVS